MTYCAISGSSQSTQAACEELVAEHHESLSALKAYNPPNGWHAEHTVLWRLSWAQPQNGSLREGYIVLRLY